MKKLINVGRKFTNRVNYLALANFIMAVGVAFAAAPSKIRGYQPKVPTKLRS